MNLKIILGSTRTGRQGIKVAKWVEKYTNEQSKHNVELVDLKEYPLPFLRDQEAPMSGHHDPAAKNWAAKVEEATAFIIITPEYNGGYSAVLKNSLDHLYKEWNDKPAAIISYGASHGGIRAAKQLRVVTNNLKMKTLDAEINIPSVWEAFDEDGLPIDKELNKKLKELIVGIENS